MSEHGKLSLLIADDDPHIRYLMEAAAGRSGSFGRVELAEDGESAMDLLRHRDQADYPDLIVSDFSMPRMDGLELIRELKRDPHTRRIPIAIITSSNIPNDREDALAAGACAFIEKPQGLDALTRILDSLRDCCPAAASVAQRYGVE